MEKSLRTVFVVLVGLVLSSVAGCGNQYEEKVVGSWDTTMPFNPRFTLAKGGSGSMSVSALGKSVEKSINWRLNGSNLIFKIDGKESGGIIKSIDDKTMVLNDPSAKMDVTFTRVK